MATRLNRTCAGWSQSTYGETPGLAGVRATDNTQFRLPGPLSSRVDSIGTGCLIRRRLTAFPSGLPGVRLPVCVCVYVCMYACIYMCVYIYIYIYVYI